MNRTWSGVSRGRQCFTAFAVGTIVVGPIVNCATAVASAAIGIGDWSEVTTGLGRTALTGILYGILAAGATILSGYRTVRSAICASSVLLVLFIGALAVAGWVSGHLADATRNVVEIARSTLMLSATSALAGYLTAACTAELLDTRKPHAERARRPRGTGRYEL